jgi:hypothetical protein
MGLRLYLIITGVGAFLALTMPGLVVIGFFLLIIPGLILMMMPTAFLYGVGFAAVRWLVRSRFSGAALNLLSAVATLALFWVIPQPGLLFAQAQLAALKQPDVMPSARIGFTGDILVKRPFESRCDSLCAALLKTPGVTSVRIEARNGHAETYRIVPDSVPGKRGEVIGHGLTDGARKYDAGDPLAEQRALEAEWNLMLADGKALVVGGYAPQTDFVIAIEDVGAAGSGHVNWSFRPSAPRRKALTVTNAAGRVLLRQSILSISAPAAPLSIWMSGGIENSRFGWARKWLGDGRAYAEVPVDRLLLGHSNVARGVDMAAAQAKTREQLARALDDPGRAAGDPAFALANQWMGSFRKGDQPLNADDRRLLARILADSRVQSSDGLWAVVEHIDGDAAEFRRLAARRYLAAEDKKAARHWVNAWAALPEGAYADLLPEERDILSDPAVSRYATGLIKRQGDRGVEAVPDLLRVLREFSVFDPGKYGYSDLTESVNAVRGGLRRIGPAASFARPEIEALLASPGLDYRYKTLGKDDWDVLLVVLGRPVHTLAKPERLSGTDERYRKRIADRAAKPYDPRRD